MSLKTLAENNSIRFINVTQKRDGCLYVNFKVNGIRNGVTYSASIAVDAAAAEVDMSDPLEKIVETCAYIAVKEIQRAEFQFQGIHQV